MQITAWKDVDGLQYIDQGGFQQRNPSTFWLMKLANQLYQWPHFPPIKICTDDFTVNNSDVSYVVDKSQYHRAIPCFSFHKWEEVNIPGYDQTVAEIIKAGSKEPEVRKAGWIGNLDTHPNRRLLYDIGKSNADTMDIMSFLVGQGQTGYMSLADLVSKYAVVIDIEGRGFSARVKYLMWSNRPLLLIQRPHQEFYYEHMVPWKHYIPVQRDMSDLVEKVKWCLDNYESAMEIAQEARVFCQTYLTHVACCAQWNRVITWWIDQQSQT